MPMGRLLSSDLLRTASGDFGAMRFGAMRFGAMRFGAMRFGAMRFGAMRFDEANWVEFQRCFRFDSHKELLLAETIYSPARNRAA